MNGLSCGRKHDNMFSRFDTIPVCDGRTDVKPIAKMCFSIADARNKVPHIPRVSVKKLFGQNFNI